MLRLRGRDARDAGRQRVRRDRIPKQPRIGEEAEPRPGLESGHIQGARNLPQGVLFNPDNSWKQGAPLRRESDNGCHTRGADWIASAGATTSPEAATAYIDFPYTLTQAMWTAPITNKILLGCQEASE